MCVADALHSNPDLCIEKFRKGSRAAHMLKMKDMHKCLWVRASRLGSVFLSSNLNSIDFSLIQLVNFGRNQWSSVLSKSQASKYFSGS